MKRNFSGLRKLAQASQDANNIQAQNAGRATFGSKVLGGLKNIGLGLAAIPYLGGKVLYDNRKPLARTALGLAFPQTVPHDVKEDILENFKRIGARTVGGIYSGANNLAKCGDLALHSIWNPRILLEKDQKSFGKTREEIMRPYRNMAHYGDDFATMFDSPYNDPSLERGANAAGVNAASFAASSIPFAMLGDRVTKLAPTVTAPNNKLGKFLLGGFTANGANAGGLVSGPILKDQLMRLAEGYGNDDYAPTDVGYGGTEKKRIGIPVRQILNSSPLGFPYRLATSLDDYEHGNLIGTRDYEQGLGDNDNPIGNMAQSLNKNVFIDAFDAWRSARKSSPEYQNIDPIMAFQSELGHMLPGRWGALGKIVGGVGELAWPMVIKPWLMNKKETQQYTTEQD